MILWHMEPGFSLLFGIFGTIINVIYYKTKYIMLEYLVVLGVSVCNYDNDILFMHYILNQKKLHMKPFR